jgi:hypothetical protein
MATGYALALQGFLRSVWIVGRCPLPVHQAVVMSALLHPHFQRLELRFEQGMPDFQVIPVWLSKTDSWSLSSR